MRRWNIVVISGSPAEVKHWVSYHIKKYNLEKPNKNKTKQKTITTTCFTKLYHSVPYKYKNFAIIKLVASKFCVFKTVVTQYFIEFFISFLFRMCVKNI